MSKQDDDLVTRHIRRREQAGAARPNPLAEPAATPLDVPRKTERPVRGEVLRRAVETLDRQEDA